MRIVTHAQKGFASGIMSLAARVVDRLIVFLVLVLFVVSAEQTFAAAGMTPREEAFIRQIYAGRTGLYDQAYINSTHWTNFYSFYSNTIYSLLGNGVTGFSYSYGDADSIAQTGHVGYFVFNTNVPPYSALAIAEYGSNTAYMVSNLLASAGGTSLWNEASITAAWASNNVIGVSNLVYDLPTNNWNAATNNALWASNTVGQVSNVLFSLPTNLWNTVASVSNDATWASNTVLWASNLLASAGGTDYWNEAHVIAEWASNNVSVAGATTNAMSGIWGLSMAGELSTLTYVQAHEAGLWRVNADGSVTPSGYDWYDTLWTTNSEGDLTPR